MEINKIKTEDKTNIGFESQDTFNEFISRDLLNLLKTNTSIPTHTPKKFVDCFWLYWDGSTTYELYIYISNSWKKVTLS